MLGMLQDELVEKLHVIRSTTDPSIDPFASLGQDKLLNIDCLFPAEDIGRLPHSHSEPPSSIAKTPKVVKSRSRPPPHYTFSSSGVLTPPHSRNASEASLIDVTHGSLPSPFGRIKGDKLQSESRAVSPTPSSGGSLLDQLLAQRAQTASPTSTATSILTDRNDSPSRDGTPTLKKSRGKYIPIDTSVEGSIGGSPPSSDEDKPSVPLPHSAIKHVQRPVPFETSPPETRGGSRKKSNAPQQLVSSGESKANTSALGLDIRGKAISTNANRVPLGQRIRGSSYAELSEAGSDDSQTTIASRVHGFRKHVA